MSFQQTSAQHLPAASQQDLEFLSQGTVFVSQLNETSLRGGGWCSELHTASRQGLISASEQFHVPLDKGEAKAQESPST